MRIALTGITGFVGQNLMPMIIKECPDMELLTLNIENDLQKAKEMYPWQQCHHILTSELDKLIEFNPEIVLHLATVTTERNDTDIIRPMLSANIEFGVLLLDALARCNSLRLFVNTGSFAEYRLGPTKINDAYLYAATKSAFRHFCDYYSQLKGFKYVTIVPYSIYGGKPTVKRLMDYVIKALDAQIPIDMTAGEQILDFTHVDDLAGFYVHILKNVELFCSLDNGEEFHIGTGKGTTIRELVGIVEQVYNGKCNINYGGRPYRERDTMHAVAPIAKNLSLVNWRAGISLVDGIIRMKTMTDVNS
jgi:CDP-paratose synthetase